MRRSMVPGRQWNGIFAAALLVAASAAVVDCAGRRPPQPLAPVAAPITPAPASDGSQAEAPPPAAAATAPVVKSDPTLVVIEPGRAAREPVSLVEASAAERARRSRSTDSKVVITNKNLDQYATGNLTVAAPSPEAAKPAEAETTPSGEGAEAYWRSRIRTARLAWRQAVDDVVHLQSEIADLRRRFYAADDPYRRDSEIKPAWDRALDQLATARQAVTAAQEEVARVLDAGRRSGALPGWLREGIELEPAPPPPPKPPAEPGEPVILDETPPPPR